MMAVRTHMAMWLVHVDYAIKGRTKIRMGRLGLIIVCDGDAR